MVLDDIGWYWKIGGGKLETCKCPNEDFLRTWNFKHKNLKCWQFENVDMFVFVGRRLVPTTYQIITKQTIKRVLMITIPVHGSWLKSQGPWLMPQGAWLKARGSWPRQQLARGPGAWGPRANLFLAMRRAIEPQALRHEPWASSHEPWAMNH